MTREEIIKYLNILKAFFLGSEHQPISDAYFALDEAIKALEHEPCEDCISRETARRIVDSGRTRQQMIDMILATPSVNPQPKTGHWIRVDKDKLKCSECEVVHFIAQYPQSAKINYCPNCGAKMESEE